MHEAGGRENALAVGGVVRRRSGDGRPVALCPRGAHRLAPGSRTVEASPRAGRMVRTQALQLSLSGYRYTLYDPPRYVILLGTSVMNTHACNMQAIPKPRPMRHGARVQSDHWLEENRQKLYGSLTFSVLFPRCGTQNKPPSGNKHLRRQYLEFKYMTESTFISEARFEILDKFSILLEVSAFNSANYHPYARLPLFITPCTYVYGSEVVISGRLVISY